MEANNGRAMTRDGTGRTTVSPGSAGHRRTPFRMPSLNASPTCSMDDLSTRGAISQQPLFKLGSCELSEKAGNSNGQRRCDSPSSYKKTLEQLSALRKQRPMLGSTSDYFSLTSSVCSEDGEYFPYEYGAEEGYECEFGWPMAGNQLEDDVRAVAQKVLGEGNGEDDGTKAALLDNICQQTRELERRNEELRQELEQLHLDTKRFVEKNADATRKREDIQHWDNEDLQFVSDDDGTVV